MICSVNVLNTPDKMNKYVVCTTGKLYNNNCLIYLNSFKHEIDAYIFSQNTGGIVVINDLYKEV